VAHAAQIDGDALIYGDIAKNLLQHGVYGFTQSAAGPLPTLIRLPGYPLFLMLCFRVFGVEHYTAVMGVQVVVDLATCALAAALAGKLFGRRAAMVTLWLAALCPFTANYVAAALTETLSLACVALAFYGMERWRSAGNGWNRWVWVTGAALAYAVLLRPEQGLLAVAVIPAMLWMAWKDGDGARRVAPVVATALCVAAPLVPWTARNWRTFHVFEPLAPRYATDPGELIPLGFQRWYRTWGIDFASTEDVYWNYNGAPIEIADLPTRAFDSQEQYAQTEALLADYGETNLASRALEARFDALAEERIKADPVRYYVALPVARLINMLLRPRTEMMPVSLEWWRWSEHHAETAFATAYTGLNLGYFVLGGLGWWMWRRRGWGEHAPLAWSMMGFVILRCALLLTLDNSEPRYTLEFFPVIVVWAGAVLSSGDAKELKEL
jgi:4-amino-4-deoxy-L-arabinose transferase-like glycosyltransferase